MRRRPANPVLEAFLRMAGSVDSAQRALLAAIPTARRQGRALAEALSEFEAHLGPASTEILEWQGDPLESLSKRCAAAIETSRALARALAEVGTPLTFEELNVRLGEVLHPLEDIADAERELRDRLRRGALD